MNFSRLSQQTRHHHHTPPARLPLTDVKRNLYCQSHILFTLFTCADNPEPCVRETVCTGECTLCVCVCGFHVHRRTCENASDFCMCVLLYSSLPFSIHPPTPVHLPPLDVGIPESLNAPSLAEICLKAPSERLVTKWCWLHPSIYRLTGGENEGWGWGWEGCLI